MRRRFRHCVPASNVVPHRSGMNRTETSLSPNGVPHNLLCDYYLGRDAWPFRNNRSMLAQSTGFASYESWRMFFRCLYETKFLFEYLGHVQGKQQLLRRDTDNLLGPRGFLQDHGRRTQSMVIRHSAPCGPTGVALQVLVANR